MNTPKFSVGEKIKLIALHPSDKMVGLIATITQIHPLGEMCKDHFYYDLTLDAPYNSHGHILTNIGRSEKEIEKYIPELFVFTQNTSWAGGCVTIAENETIARIQLKEKYGFYDDDKPLDSHPLTNNFIFTFVSPRD